MYATVGSTWSNPNLSFSYVPDGTASEGYTSTLFSKLDAVAPRNVWQREFARTLQTWANVSNLNFREVADSGTASGGSGAQGDIRLAAHPLNYLAYAYYPSSSFTIGGDVFLATQYTFGVGADYDLYSVLLHETGHSLGLDHTSGTVMNSSYQGILAGLTSDDIAGIRSLYGARSEDSFDAVLRNDSLAAASVLTLDASGAKSLTGDLTSLTDVDYFRLTAPTAFDGSLRATVDARDISLLQARVLVYNGSGALIGSADATTYEGLAELTLSGLAPGQTYYVVADGAATDAFGMGKYGLSVAFGGVSTPPPPPPTTGGNPVATYHFDETSGTTASDASGSGNNGTYFNNPTLGQAGAVGSGTAASFNGVNQYVALPSTPFGSYGTSGYTLSFETWFNAPVGSSGVILGQTNGGTVPGGTSPSGWVPAVHLGTDGKLRSSLFWHSDVNARLVSPGATTYNDGNWHHVAVTYANGVETLYIDGVQVGQQAQPEVAYSGSYNYYLGTGYAGGWAGGNGGWHFFGGRLDEAALYQRALTGTEVAQHFAAAAASLEAAGSAQPPTTAKLQMDQGLEIGTSDDGIVARRNRTRVVQWKS